MTGDVFISYKAEEFDEANYMKMVLEKNGISCWMAPSCMPGGSNYAKEIPQAISNSKIFLLILSEKAQESTWIPKELDQAINAGKIIMPFMTENFTLSDDFNFYLSNVQRYTAYENKAAAINKIVREIQAVLGSTVNRDAEPAVEPTPVPTPVPDSEPERVPEKKVKKELLFWWKKSIFNAYNWKHANEPKFRFSLNVYSWCALLAFILRFTTDDTFFSHSFVMEILGWGIGVLGAWYGGYFCCFLLVKIKKYHKFFSVILGVWSYAVIFAFLLGIISTVLYELF